MPRGLEPFILCCDRVSLWRDTKDEGMMLTLSHWSSDLLGRFPPFCMFLIFDNPAPVTPNIFPAVSTCRIMWYSVQWVLTARMIPYGMRVSKGTGMAAEVLNAGPIGLAKRREH